MAKTSLNTIAQKHGIHFSEADTSSDRFQQLIERLAVNGKVVLLIDEYDAWHR